METNPKKENELLIGPAVWMALRYYPAGFTLADWVLLAALILIPVCLVLCFLFSGDKIGTPAYYERMNCIRYEQTYEEIFIPALGKNS